MPKKQKTHSKIHESKEIYIARQFSLVSEKITIPNGVDTEIAFVRHPGSTVIVPLFVDGTIGLIKQYRHPVFKFSIPEIQDMIDQDKIVNALSILAIYRAMRYLLY